MALNSAERAIKHHPHSFICFDSDGSLYAVSKVSFHLPFGLGVNRSLGYGPACDNDLGAKHHLRFQREKKAER